MSGKKNILDMVDQTYGETHKTHVSHFSYEMFRLWKSVSMGLTDGPENEKKFMQETIKTHKETLIGLCNTKQKADNIQILAKWLELRKSFARWLDAVNAKHVFLVIDECHHMNTTFKRSNQRKQKREYEGTQARSLLKFASRCKFVLAMTATPVKSDIREFENMYHLLAGHTIEENDEKASFSNNTMTNDPSTFQSTLSGKVIMPTMAENAEIASSMPSVHLHHRTVDVPASFDTITYKYRNNKRTHNEDYDRELIHVKSSFGIDPFVFLGGLRRMSLSYIPLQQKLPQTPTATRNARWTVNR